MVGGPDAAIWNEVGAFGKTLEAVQKGPLVFREGDNLPFGKEWNTAKNLMGRKSFSRWASELQGIHFATTIEIPYARARGGEVNGDSARAFGVDLARAIRVYLKRMGKAENPR